MNKTLQQLANKFAALNQRERWVVFFAGLAVIFAILNFFVLTPIIQQQQGLSAEIAQTHSQHADIQQQISTFKQNPLLDVDTENQQKMTALNLALQAQSQQLASLQASLVSPQNMPALLKSLMRDRADMQLVGMKTLAPENFLIKKNAVQVADSQLVAVPTHADAAPVIYKHGLVFTVSGQYMDLLSYAEALQALSKQVLWEKAELNVKAYPASELTVTVYTLSLDKTWLSI